MAGISQSVKKSERVPWNIDISRPITGVVHPPKATVTDQIVSAVFHWRPVAKTPERAHPRECCGHCWIQLFRSIASFEGGHALMVASSGAWLNSRWLPVTGVRHRRARWINSEQPPLGDPAAVRLSRQHFPPTYLLSGFPVAAIRGWKGGFVDFAGSLIEIRRGFLRYHAGLD